jgi:hypothetical protein
MTIAFVFRGGQRRLILSVDEQVEVDLSFTRVLVVWQWMDPSLEPYPLRRRASKGLPQNRQGASGGCFSCIIGGVVMIYVTVQKRRRHCSFMSRRQIRRGCSDAETVVIFET